MSNKSLKFKVIDKYPEKCFRDIFEVFVLTQDGKLCTVHQSSLEEVPSYRFKAEFENE